MTRTAEVNPETPAEPAQVAVSEELAREARAWTAERPKPPAERRADPRHQARSTRYDLD